tara:strand:- start:462 stop:1100 length:639 start_codon:yes stop_codon:yes gene_type:complete
MFETLKKVSLSRILQNYYLKKFNILENGNVIEFGSSKNSSKSFHKNINGNFSIDFADKILGKNNLRFDLEKENEVNKKYTLVIIFNVLEHVYNVDNAVKELKKILKPSGKIVGATPFLYRVHYAPEDYNRYTKQFFFKLFKENNMKNIKIEELGFGPLTLCYSILFDYLKYIPFLSNVILTICILLDKFLSIFIKTPLKTLYPLSYIFYCEN